MKVDLHVHTTASDGMLSPAEMVQFAQKRGISVLSVTDHDTIDGVLEAQRAAKTLKLIRGVELSAQWEEMHILGYCIDPESPELQETLFKLRLSRDRRNPQIVARLRQLGMDITIDEVKEEGKGSMGRPDVYKRQA